MSFDSSLTRRGFVRAASAAGLSVGLSRTEAHAGAADIPIVDTHQHLWDLNQLKLPWLEGAPEVLKHSYGLPEYAKATAGLNVIQAVYMEVDVTPEQQVQEAETLIAICRSGSAPTKAAVISGRPGSEGFADYIRPLSKNGEIKGVRQVLHPPETKRGTCLEPQFVKSLNLLGELGLSFDLCMRPTELEDGVTVARRCPGTRFIVDHCGNADPAAFLPAGDARDAAGHDAEAWRGKISRLAECDNVICKISGIIARAPKGVPYAEALAPVINHCLDAFGPDRVIYGGDWPVCLLGGAYADWVTSLRTVVADRPLADQKKLFHQNAQKFYRLPTA